MQFTAIRHCFSASAFICQSIFHLWDLIWLASIGQIHDAFNKKNMMHLFTLFFSSFFEGNCEGSLRSSEQHPLYACQTRSAQSQIEPVTQDPSSARGTARPSRCERICLYAPRCFFYLKKRAGCSLGRIPVQYSWLNTNGSALVNRAFMAIQPSAPTAHGAECP